MSHERRATVILCVAGALACNNNTEHNMMDAGSKGGNNDVKLDGGRDGSVGSGGQMTDGGASGSSRTATGGVPGSGGKAGRGGETGSGGKAGTGGTTAAGGMTGTGKTGSGGRMGSGGKEGAGGTIGTGGVNGTGGSDPSTVAGCGRLSATKAGSSTTYKWSDALCNPRALSTDDSKGVITSVTYKVDGADRVCGKTGDQQWQGLGYLISDTGLNFCTTTPTMTTPLQGTHHAIHRFSRPSGCSTNVNIDVFFATGRDHPIIAVSYDTSNSRVTGDSRFPYGELRFDGANNDSNAVSGIGWGDSYKFATTTALKELATTGWDYMAKNTVPYDKMWIVDPDAEIGFVQTQTYAQQDAGGYDFGGGDTTKNYYGKTSANGPLPSVELWPYQLNQYSTPTGTSSGTPWYTSSKRFAWGTQYNAVGSASYTGVDGTQRSGKPHFGYSLFLVLGKHSLSVTDKTVEQIENVQGATLTAQTGTILTQGPVGAGRTTTTAYQPAGYNHVYSIWEANAQNNEAKVTLHAPASGLLNPILVVHQYDSAADPSVTIDGAALEAGRGFFASNDTSTKTLWITLYGNYLDTKAIAVAPKP